MIPTEALFRTVASFHTFALLAHGFVSEASAGGGAPKRLEPLQPCSDLTLGKGCSSPEYPVDLQKPLTHREESGSKR